MCNKAERVQPIVRDFVHGEADIFCFIDIECEKVGTKPVSDQIESPLGVVEGLFPGVGRENEGCVVGEGNYLSVRYVK